MRIHRWTNIRVEGLAGEGLGPGAAGAARACAGAPIKDKQ